MKPNYQTDRLTPKARIDKTLATDVEQIDEAHGGKTLWGKRILGDHKTRRGLLTGIVMGTLVYEL